MAWVKNRSCAAARDDEKDEKDSEQSRSHVNTPNNRITFEGLMDPYLGTFGSIGSI